MKNKMKQLLVRSKYELKYFFKIIYKRKIVTAIPELLRLIYDDLLINLT